MSGNNSIGISTSGGTYYYPSPYGQSMPYTSPAFRDERLRFALELIAEAKDIDEVMRIAKKALGLKA